MMLKIQLYITGINYIRNYIETENGYFKVVIFHNIQFYYIVDQINAALVNINILNHHITPNSEYYSNYCNKINATFENISVFKKY